MGDWKDILADSEEPLSEEDLLKYLEKTSGEKTDLTDELDEGSFESDAIEGLQKIQDTEKVKKHVKQLKQKLQQQLQSKKQRNEKGKIKDFQWMIITLLILLFICIVSYLLIRMHSIHY